MKISLGKLKAILTYFGTNTENKFLGKTKLMKLFYFLDFEHVRQHGAPVTYDFYVNLPHGPIPSEIKNIIDNEIDDTNEQKLLTDIASFKKIEISEEKFMWQMIPKKLFDKNDKKLFSRTEFDVLRSICEKYGDKDTEYVENKSHRESPWRKTTITSHIPYSLAIDDARDKSVIDKEMVELTLKIQQCSCNKE